MQTAAGPTCHRCLGVLTLDGESIWTFDGPVDLVTDVSTLILDGAGSLTLVEIDGASVTVTNSGVTVPDQDWEINVATGIVFVDGLPLCVPQTGTTT